MSDDTINGVPCVDIQRAAEEHLDACAEALFAMDEGKEVDSPASAPYCGCETCVVRETLYAGFLKAGLLDG